VPGYPAFQFLARILRTPGQAGSGRRSPAKKPPVRFRPKLEQLEERALLSVFSVTRQEGSVRVMAGSFLPGGERQHLLVEEQLAESGSFDQELARDFASLDAGADLAAAIRLDVADLALTVAATTATTLAAGDAHHDPFYSPNVSTQAGGELVLEFELHWPATFQHSGSIHLQNQSTPSPGHGSAFTSVFFGYPGSGAIFQHQFLPLGETVVEDSGRLEPGRYSYHLFINASHWIPSGPGSGSASATVDLRLEFTPLDADAAVTADFGSVTITSPSGEQRTVVPGQWARLFPGDRVETGDNSQASIRLNDSYSEIYLWSNSTFYAENVGEETVLDLIKGFLRNVIRRRHWVQVRTPIVAVAVRGTEFTVGFTETEGFGTSTVSVDSGEVDVTHRRTGTLLATLSAGDYFELVRPLVEPAWQNIDNPGDVNGDGSVTVGDLLAVVAYLRENGPGDLPLLPDTPPAGYVDVNGDGRATLADLLAVVALLREGLAGAPQAEGEEEFGASLYAFDELHYGTRRRLFVFADTPGQWIPVRGNATISLHG
jgi:hypothetical protein